MPLWLRHWILLDIRSIYLYINISKKYNVRLCNFRIMYETCLRLYSGPKMTSQL